MRMCAAFFCPDHPRVETLAVFFFPQRIRKYAISMIQQLTQPTGYPKPTIKGVLATNRVMIKR